MKRAALLLLALLVGCGDEPAKKVDSVLTAVLPSPATPGDAVTAYGRFPSGAKLKLDGRDVPVVAVPDGLRFTVPALHLAGVHEVRVEAATPLTGSVQVVPRIDDAAALASLGFAGDLVGVVGVASTECRGVCVPRKPKPERGSGSSARVSASVRFSEKSRPCLRSRRYRSKSSTSWR